MIVDFHTHIFPPYVISRRDQYVARDVTMATLFSNPRSAMATAEELLTVMDEAQVDVAVVMGMGWTDPQVASEINEYLLESAARHPGRLVPFCSVNPAWGDAALQEIERCARLGARGVGELHPDNQGFDLADGLVMDPLVDLMRSHGLVLLTHSSEPVGHDYSGKGTVTPQILLRFIEQFPDLPVVCAHWGGGLPFYSLMPEVRSAMGNTYFDTAASPLLYQAEVFSAVPQLVDPSRILLGSDFPLVKPQRLVREVQAASLTAEEKRAILGANAQRLLGLAGITDERPG
jgi:hypothetical protein